MVSLGQPLAPKSPVLGLASSSHAHTALPPFTLTEATEHRKVIVWGPRHGLCLERSQGKDRHINITLC